MVYLLEKLFPTWTTAKERTGQWLWRKQDGVTIQFLTMLLAIVRPRYLECSRCDDDDMRAFMIYKIQILFLRAYA